MIFFLRKFLLTIVVLIVATIWDAPIAIRAAGVGIAILLDIFVTSRSKDLQLYRDNLDLAAPVSLMDWRDAARLHSIAILATPMIALVPHVLDADPSVHVAFAMTSLLMCGYVASYCGLFHFGTWQKPRDLLHRAWTATGEAGLVIDLFPPTPRAIMGGLLRILLAPFMMFFLPLMLAASSTEPVNLKFAALLIGAAFLFQLGFLVLILGIFSLRWVRRQKDLQTRPEPAP
jgi:hypothetical protein